MRTHQGERLRKMSGKGDLPSGLDFSRAFPRARSIFMGGANFAECNDDRAIVPGVLAGRADRSESTRNWLQEGGFMTLRIMLMGLVASMGYDLPSGPDLSCWAQAGRDWVHSRMADLTGSEVEADCPDLGLTDCHRAKAPVSIEPSVIAEEVKVSDDSAFVAVSEAMVGEFAADLMTIRDETSPVEDAPVMVAGDAPPVGLPGGEELTVQVSPVGEAEKADVFKSDDMPSETTDETDKAPPQADLSSAIRLTREAVQAWANLMPQPSDESSPAR